jgi:molybdate transport system substrate-binding protein
MGQLAVLDHLADDRDARRAQQLAKLGEVVPLAERGDHEGTLTRAPGLAGGAGAGLGGAAVPASLHDVESRVRAVRRRGIGTLVCVVLAAASVACGSGEDERPEIDVVAATSLRDAFSAYANAFDGARVRLTFAGSEALADAIRSGERPDVYAAAEAQQPERLHAEGLVDEPVLFAGNELVVVVRRDDRSIRRVDDLAEQGVRLAIAGARVSLGTYTREVLDRLDAGIRDAIEGNVVRTAPDVGAVVAGVASGEVEAGFAYLSDVRASRGRLRAVTLAPRLQPSVLYKAAVVRGTRRRREARAFVDGLRGPAGRRALSAAGFRVP